jgi:hypothetical protein
MRSSIAFLTKSTARSFFATLATSKTTVETIGSIGATSYRRDGRSWAVGVEQLAVTTMAALDDIVAVIGSRINLTRRGNRYTGRCPFHDDQVPSLFVNPKTQIFFCFGCKAQGDAKEFLRLYARTIS